MNLKEEMAVRLLLRIVGIILSIIAAVIIVLHGGWWLLAGIFLWTWANNILGEL